MKIAEIRKAFDVPAKPGMKVRVKSGDRAGCEAVILGADTLVDGYLKIRDATGSRNLRWWRRIHPTALEYT